MELQYKEKEDMFIESDYISEVTAVFTTANARVRLYRMLDGLDPSQVAYCDTDSVIFLVNKIILSIRTYNINVNYLMA